MKPVRALCWLIGHRWRVLVVDMQRAAVRGHLHTLAGCAALCHRCGAEWNDLPGHEDRRALPPAARSL